MGVNENMNEMKNGYSNPNQSFNNFLFPQFGTTTLFKDNSQNV